MKHFILKSTLIGFGFGAGYYLTTGFFSGVMTTGQYLAKTLIALGSGAGMTTAAGCLLVGSYLLIKRNTRNTPTEVIVYEPTPRERAYLAAQQRCFNTIHPPHFFVQRAPVVMQQKTSAPPSSIAPSSSNNTRSANNIAKIVYTTTTDDNKKIPHEFLCPITSDVMQDPVILIDSGQTYERQAIERWLLNHHTDPVSGSVIFNKTVTPNIALRKLIVDHNEKQTKTVSTTEPLSEKRNSTPKP